MKYTLFIDNFRGFSNTFIPITDVNFLVGENSTGKTSVLGLMKLLSGASFFLSNRYGFSDAPVNFGNFSDMVSAHASNQHYFRIGAIWEPPNSGKKGREKMAMGHLLTFMDDDGVPRLARYTFCMGRHTISIAYRNNREVFYRTETTAKPVTLGSIRSRVPSWVSEHSRNISSRYSKLTLPKDFPKASTSFSRNVSSVGLIRPLGDQQERGNSGS